MAFLPKRVKDLPPLEPDSEDEFKTPQKTKTQNKENIRLPSSNMLLPRRVKGSEMPLLESDSDDDFKNDSLNCAILNDSFVISPAKSEQDDKSPGKHQVTSKPSANDSLPLLFDNLTLNKNVPSAFKQFEKSPPKPVDTQRQPKSLPSFKVLQESAVVGNSVPSSVVKPTGVELETPLKEVESQFTIPQVRSWSIARRPRDLCSTKSHKTRSAIASEFSSQKVLFQTPMAVARAPIACTINDSITLSLCDTINESGTPNTGEKPAPEIPNKSDADVKSKKSQKSLHAAFSVQEAELKKEQQPTESKENIVTINGSDYIIKKKLGCGGSSSVYLANRKDSGKDCALKIVDLRGDSAVINGYLNETKLLAKLQGNICVVSLYEYELLAKESKLYMVMEKGESDLHKILQQYKTNLPLYVLMNFWYQMLQAVNYIHQNGVIHSDLKPANFLMIHGRLKLIDFGIASNIAHDSTSIIKFSQAGTFNYISPEALIDTSSGNSPMGKHQPKIKISTTSDVWSLGCILYLLLYHKTPFGHIKNIYAKVNAITSPKTEIQYPDIPSFYPIMLVQMAKKCLQHNPKQRPSCADLLRYPFNMVIPIQNLSVQQN